MGLVRVVVVRKARHAHSRRQSAQAHTDAIRVQKIGVTALGLTAGGTSEGPGRSADRLVGGECVRSFVGAERAERAGGR